MWSVVVVVSGQMMVTDRAISWLDVCSHSGALGNWVGLEEITCGRAAHPS